MTIVAVPLLLAFALLGRWVQLHPERIVPKGWFMGENTIGARMLRAEAAAVGVFAVFGGTSFALSTALQPLTSGQRTLQLLTMGLAAAVGVLSVIYVRKEVRRQPPHKSTSPYGWWP